MKTITTILFLGLTTILISCTQKTKTMKDLQYSSSITFLYYDDFTYGSKFVENVLQLDLVMDQGFAKVYSVNEKAFWALCKKKILQRYLGIRCFH
jgi:hypothetical protein